LVRSDGKISLSYVGDVQAALRSPAELTKELNDRYDEVLKSPDVAVIITKESGRRVYVGGEVQLPGVLTLHPNQTLVQALFVAGGLTMRAHRGEVLIMRACPDGGVHTVKTNVDRILAGIDPDIRLEPLDVIHAPSSVIAKVGDFVEMYINRIIPQPFQAVFTYELHTQPLEGNVGSGGSFPVEIIRR
jgi:polysaccharide biosynthesis/export protein PslD